MQALRNVQCCQAPWGFKKIALTVEELKIIFSGRREQLLQYCLAFASFSSLTIVVIWINAEETQILFDFNKRYCLVRITYKTPQLKIGRK